MPCRSNETLNPVMTCSKPINFPIQPRVSSYFNTKTHLSNTITITFIQPHTYHQMPPKRMTANQVQAPRYRPGKIIAEEASSSESEASEDEATSRPTKTISAPPKVTTAGGITSNLGKVDLNERRKIAAAKEALRIEEEKALKAKEEEGFETEESEDEEGSEEEESEEEESSEDEAPRKPMMRPKFIPKSKRNTQEIDRQTEEELAAAREVERLAEVDRMIEQQLAQERAAKAAGKKNWDDDEEVSDVDDTDDIDPEAEYAAWKLRELKRIKREREAIENREKELEEVERRKNLTEEERKAEDDAYITAQREEKESKGKMSYMQKYYHKGAFYQDDTVAAEMEKRDIMGSRFQDSADVELLPQALQMRDMTKIGKKGATKYRDLKSEDTGKWGQFDDKRPGKGGFGGYNADERFMSDRDREKLGTGPSGANNMPVAERKPRVSGAPEGPKAMREGSDDRRREERERNVDSYRPGRDRSRSCSRSPRRDKRRRIDSR